MSFRKQLNEALSKQGMTGKKLSQITGISEGAISGYRNGATPTSESKKLICKTLGIKQEEKKVFKSEVEFVGLDEVASRLGISRESVMCCMQQDKFPGFIGICWKGRHTDSWNYRVFRKPFEKMMEVIGGEK